MVQLIKRYQGSIIAALVSSFIFLYFLQPILDFSGRCLLHLTSFLGSEYSDRIYSQAAHLTTQDYSFFLLMFALGTFTILMLFFSIFFLSFYFPKSESKDEKHERTNPLHRAMHSKTIALLNFGVAVLCTLAFIVILIGNYTQLSLITSFNQHMRIIAPFLDQQQEKKLIADWSSMKSQDDYNRLYKKLQNIAIANGIQLPRNKIYGPLTI